MHKPQVKQFNIYMQTEYNKLSADFYLKLLGQSKLIIDAATQVIFSSYGFNGFLFYTMHDTRYIT